MSKDKIEGRDVLIVEYKQTKPTLRIKVNGTDAEWKAEPNGISYDTFLPNNFRPTNPRLKGKIWLDAETAQIWRNEFTVTIQPAFLSKPVISGEYLDEYQSSKFGILVPKRFYFVSKRFVGKGEKDLVATKAAAKTFEYTNFRKPDSEVKDTKIGN